jgi:nucleoside-diphosphate-sugar epimerase
MNVLVIGGTGFLSSAVVQTALDAGHTVSVVTRGSANRPAPPEGVEALVADRSNAESLKAALGDRTFDIVVDCVLFRPVDAESVVTLFQGRTKRYVFISTDFVYGGEPRTFPLSEDAPRASLNAYGANKAACEDIFTQAYAASGFPVVTLRPPHILGAGALLGTGSLEGRDAWLLWRLRGGHPLLLLDGGALLIQPVHKSDIARAAFAVAVSERTLGRAYNMSGPDCVTTRRYYEMICEIAGAPAPDVLSLPAEAYLAAWPDRAAFAQNRCYSLARLKEDADFEPTVRLSEALAEVITYLDAKGNPEGAPPVTDTPLISLLLSHVPGVKEALLGAA